MRDLNVVLPGLMWPDNGDYGYLYSQLELPNFSRLIGPAASSLHPLRFSDFAYARDFGPSNLSLAQQYAHKLGLAASGSFLLIEPTHLRVDRDRLLISEAELLQLDATEATQLIEVLNQHFNVAGWSFYYLSAELWLLGIRDELGALRTTPLLDIVGENIDEHLPSGSGGFKLHQLLNEIQMLFHDLPLNRERERSGLLVANSVWLWDKERPQLPFEVATTLSNNPKFGATIDNLAQQLTFSDSLILDQAYYPGCYRDSFSWLEVLRGLDTSVAPELLRQRSQRNLNIWLPLVSGSLKFKLSGLDSWKFWRRKSLQECFSAFYSLE